MGNQKESTLFTVNLNCAKAVEDPVACENFSQGHMDVLKDLGIKKLTSADVAWHHNPNSYVISVRLDGQPITVAGARVDVYNQRGSLPIESAIGEIDKSVFDIVEEYGARGTGEVCGLWTSKQVAGNGLAFTLIKSAIIVANILKLDSLFALCSPFTVSMFSKVGFEIVKSLGNDGTFYYPKLDLIATAMILKDPMKLEKALPENREKILSLMGNPAQAVVEHGMNGPIKIEYNLNNFRK